MKLSFGLNDRSSSRPDVRGSGDRSTSNNVFMENDDDEDDEDDTDDRSARGGAAPTSSSRSRVNRDLRREQEALRRRAEHQQRREDPKVAASASASAAAEDSSLYDYDGSYESFKPSHSQPTAPSKGSARPGHGPKTSKYVGELLRAAELRQKEHEMRIERKVAKEQADEEAAGDESLLSKDKFVTSAYKRKLQERELWQQEQQALEAHERQADVTLQRNSSVAMSTFYSNLNRNVAMGGSGGGDGKRGNEAGSEGRRTSKSHETLASLKQPPASNREFDVRSGSFVDGFERPSGSHENDEGASSRHAASGNRSSSYDGATSGVKTTTTESSEQIERRTVRERKLEEARVRYYERHPDRRRRQAAT